MANRYFNKQVAESRKPLAEGGPAGTGKGAAPFKGPRKARPSLAAKIKKARPDPKGTSKSGKKPAGWTLVKPSPTTKKSRMEERMKNSKPESPERKKKTS